MFSALAIGLCTLFTPVPLSAQSAAPEKIQRLAAQLALTPDQKRQLIPILVAEAPKVQAIKNDPSLTKMQKLQQLKAVHDQTDPQVRTILTPEQYQKLQEIRRQELQRVIGQKMNR